MAGGVLVIDRRPWARALVRIVGELLGLGTDARAPAAIALSVGAWGRAGPLPEAPYLRLGGPEPLERFSLPGARVEIAEGWLAALAHELAHATGARPRDAAAGALLDALGEGTRAVGRWPELARAAGLGARDAVELLAAATDLATASGLLGVHPRFAEARLEAAERLGPSALGELTALIEDEDLDVGLRGRALRAHLRVATDEAAEPLLAAAAVDPELGPLARDLSSRPAPPDPAALLAELRARLASGAAPGEAIREAVARGADPVALLEEARGWAGALVAGADRAGRSALLRLARAEAAPESTRRAALLALATKERSREVRELTERALASSSAELSRGGLDAGLALGEDGIAALLRAAESAPLASTRVGALERLSVLLTPARLGPALAKADRDDDSAIRFGATRIAARELGLDAAALEGLEPALAAAAVGGTLELGRAAGPILASWVAAPTLPEALRAAALLALADPERAALFERQPELRALKARADATASAPPAAVTAPLPPAEATGPLSPADATAPLSPAGATAPLPPAAAPLPTRPLPPADTIVDAPTERVHPAAQDLGGAVDATEPHRPASERPTEPARPADWAAEVARTVPRAPGRPGAVRVEGLPAKPGAEPRSRARAPAPRRDDRAIPLEKAREALDAALRAGGEGRRMLGALAASPRVPEVIRMEALRVHVERLPGGALDRLLLRLLDGPAPPSLRNQAFAEAVRRVELPLEVVARLAHDDTASPGLRMRAVRHLGAVTDKRKTRPYLDALLASGEPHVARAALLSLFSTLRFTPRDRIEEALINLLDRHREAEVCASAARALGVFGRSPASIEALRRARGLLAHPLVNEAVDWALARR